MKIIDVLTKKIELSDKIQKIAGIALMAVIFAALVVYCNLFLEISILTLVILFLLIGAACIKFNIYKLPFFSSAAIHFLCIAIGIVCGIKTGKMISNDSMTYIYICQITGAFGYFGFAELSFGALSSAFGNENHPELFAKTLIVSISLFFTMFIFIPSETYFSNSKQLLYPYSSFAGHFVIKTAVYSVIAALFICSFNKRFIAVLTYLMVGLLLCVYSQYMFMNDILPSAIEDKVDWESMHSEFVINSLIWAGLIAVPFIAAALINKLKLLKEGSEAVGLIRYVSLFLGGMQFITLAVMLIGNSLSQPSSSFTCLNGEEQFVVSKNKNIITFILDDADQVLFEKAYNETPERFECLKDFTYYTNTAMVYDATNLSIPQMLTGAQTYPEYAIGDWHNEICNAEPAREMYSRLRENNYRINVFANFVTDYLPFRDLFDNTKALTSDDIKIIKSKLYDEIGTVAAYRYAPIILKQFSEPVLFGNGAILIENSCIYDNIPFKDNADLSFSDIDCNYFIVQHLTGTHGYTNVSEIETQDCLDLLEKYFAELKRLGVYDSSDIIVTADHGNHCVADNMPIFYIKYAGQTNDTIQFCSAPVSHTDFAATWLDAAGLYRSGDEELFGRPISQIDENEQRERTVFQRGDFNYVGQVEWKTLSDKNHVKALFGYNFIGNKEDLKRHEENDPPDIVIETDGY